MKNELPEKIMQWLQSNPTLDEIAAEFPELREKVRTELAETVAGGNSGLPSYLKRMIRQEQELNKMFHSRRGDKKIAARLINQMVSTRTAHLAVKQHLISEATGIEKGKVRFNFFNGYIAQTLFFSEALQRKPVSLFWFKLLWPILSQRNLLMPLVQPEGIYCFYSSELIQEIAALAGSSKCLEIAAGDGTLTRFLAEAGLNITATDDYSWSHEVKYPSSVEKRTAQEALHEYLPEVVICSWPPAENSFEKQVFKTKSVKMYLVIASRHKFAAGNWDDYNKQALFDFEESEKLSRLVLPPELDAAVYIFKRKCLGK